MCPLMWDVRYKSSVWCQVSALTTMLLATLVGGALALYFIFCKCEKISISFQYRTGKILKSQKFSQDRKTFIHPALVARPSSPTDRRQGSLQAMLMYNLPNLGNQCSICNTNGLEIFNQLK